VARIFEIGRFRLDAEVGVLRDGRPTALGVPAVALPTALIERANAFVPKASLLDAAWRLQLHPRHQTVAWIAHTRVYAQGVTMRNAKYGHDRPAVIVLGCDEVGSAVAHAAHCAGYAVILIDGVDPGWARRGMSYVDAWYVGGATLEHVDACFCASARSIGPVLALHGHGSLRRRGRGKASPRP
jgi:hypothetical protein